MLMEIRHLNFEFYIQPFVQFEHCNYQRFLQNTVYYSLCHQMGQKQLQSYLLYMKDYSVMVM